MSHYAKVRGGLVIEVIHADAAFMASMQDTSPGRWIQTSYNTRGGIHYGPDGKPDNEKPLRANFAGVGYTYDRKNDVFYAPQPYPSWTISAPTWRWQAPKPYPTDGAVYVWDEPTLSWKPKA